MRYRQMYKALVVFLLACLPGMSQVKIELANKVYDQHIKTVQLYPQGSNSNAQLGSPAVLLRSNQPLVLEFDELFNDEYTYLVKYIRCEANWTQSQLSDLEFLSSYNEFKINQYDYSFSTLTPYVHYKAILPIPKLSGNYVLVVYADGDENDVIITRRFMVYENRVAFTDEYGFSGLSQVSRFNQQLQFEINYSGVEIQNPRDQVSVTLLQNQRWDNAHLGIKPTFVREVDRQLEYRYFTEETTFPGDNEFRYFDIRSLKYFGEHVKTVHFEKGKIFGWIEGDRPRGELAYSSNNLDINGKYVIDNVEGRDPIIENDYANIEFTLNTPKVDGKVYVTGALTDWTLNKDNELIYDEASESYKGSLILKQGWYNYQYVVKSKNLDPNYFEGNWSATKNQYEIIVYFRPYNLASDLIIGYLSLNQ